MSVVVEFILPENSLVKLVVLHQQYPSELAFCCGKLLSLCFRHLLDPIVRIIDNLGLVNPALMHIGDFVRQSFMMRPLYHFFDFIILLMHISDHIRCPGLLQQVSVS